MKNNKNKINYTVIEEKIKFSIYSVLVRGPS